MVYERYHKQGGKATDEVVALFVKDPAGVRLVYTVDSTSDGGLLRSSWRLYDPDSFAWNYAPSRTSHEQFEMLWNLATDAFGETNADYLDPIK